MPRRARRPRPLAFRAVGGGQNDRVALQRAAWAVLACAALMLGCGDSGEKSAQNTATATTATTATPAPSRIGPRPAESPADAANRIAAAVRSGDCSSPADIFTEADTTPAQCKSLLTAIEPAAPPEVKTFGSGAVMKGADGGRVILALDRDRRFKVATSFDASFPLEVVPAKKADDVMSYVLAAMRNGDCRTVLQYSLTFSNGGSGKQFCNSQQVRQLRNALNKDTGASPAPLGGDGSFAFYGLQAKGSGYYTIMFIATRGGTYAFVTSVRA
jgi:hypothetical protein